ncbi:hypothetical protein D6779_00380 [Candidatus Parcubacteria bacterium]|nr:MAG: hypothetical protein D6779_00380 [Candidatus Parcubacteria bacterium]
MSISDELMLRYYELLTDVDLDAVRAMHPMEAKKQLAAMIVDRFHGEGAGKIARHAFEQQFSRKEVPDDLEVCRVSAPRGEIGLAALLCAIGRTKSNSEAFRLIQQQAVSIDGKKVIDRKYIVKRGEYLIQAGRKFIRKVIIE